jgi:hypothetical protein
MSPVMAPSTTSGATRRWSASRRQTSTFSSARAELGDQPLTTPGASISTRHVGGGPGLVNEDQPVRIQARLVISPDLARGRYIPPLLLGGMQRLFLSVSPHAFRKRLTDERPTRMRRFSSSCISSSSVMSGRAASSS